MGLMKSWFEIESRAILGPGPEDDKEAIILGRVGFKNPHTCNIPAVVASVRIFESGVGRDETTGKMNCTTHQQPTLVNT